MIVQVIFHRPRINFIKIHGFSSIETSFLALHVFEIGSPGVPVSEAVLVLVLSLMKAISMDPISIKQTFTNSYLRNSIRLLSNQFSWSPWIFFQPKPYPPTFNQCNWFPRKSYTQSFNFFHDFPTTRFCSQWFPISEKGFFLVFTVSKRNFFWFLADGDDFHSFLMDEMNFNCFSDNEFQFRAFPMNEINFDAFSSMESTSMRFQATLLFFVEFPLRIGWLRVFFCLKLTSKV